MNLVFVSLQSLLNRINIYVRKFIDQLEFHDGNTERNSDDKDFDGIRHKKATQATPLDHPLLIEPIRVTKNRGSIWQMQ